MKNPDDGSIVTHYILVDTVRRLVAAGAPEPDIASPGLSRGRLCAFWLHDENPIGSIVVTADGKVLLTIMDVLSGDSTRCSTEAEFVTLLRGYRMEA